MQNVNSVDFVVVSASIHKTAEERRATPVRAMSASVAFTIHGIKVLVL
jgi:hypothetical protein